MSGAVTQLKTEFRTVNGREIWKDYFLTKNEKLDFCLVVEGKELWIPKHFMAFHSPYFNALCLGNFKDAKDGRAVLKGKTFNDVLLLLEVLVPHPRTKIFNVDDIPALLLLAHEWDIVSIMLDCWDILKKGENLSPPLSMRLLGAFNLMPLEEIPKDILGLVLSSVVGNGYGLQHEFALDTLMLLYRQAYVEAKKVNRTVISCIRCKIINAYCQCTRDLMEVLP